MTGALNKTPPPLATLSKEAAMTFYDQNASLAYQRPPAQSQYNLNPDACIALWNDSDLVSMDKLLNKQFALDKHHKLATTLFPTTYQEHPIGYQNNWRSKQRDLLRYIKPGEWYFGTSHNNPTQRLISTYTLQQPDFVINTLRFSMDQIRHYVGVHDTSNKIGTVAIDAPRHHANRYSAGHVNPKNHPSLLWRLRFPEHIHPAIQQAYINNIRTWSILLQKVIQFSPEPQVHDMAWHNNMRMVQQCGQSVFNCLQATRRQQHDPLDMTHLNVMEANLHLPLNLGLNIPLNRQTLTELWGEEAWFTLKRIIRDKRNFWRNERYTDAYEPGAMGYVLHSEQSRMVHLEAAPEWLKPLHHDLVVPLWDFKQYLMSFLSTIQTDYQANNWHDRHHRAELMNALKPVLPAILNLPIDTDIKSFNVLINELSIHLDNAPAAQQEDQIIDVIFDRIQDFIDKNSIISGHFLSPRKIFTMTEANPSILGFEPLGQLFHIDLLKSLIIKG